MLPFLDGLDVIAIERPGTGDLDREVSALNDAARGALAVGVSGGATLGLALAASDTRMAGAILHEPAVGSLVPGLLAPMAAAFATGGAPGFARALYGDSWTPAMAPDPSSVARELPMFRAFEPAPPSARQGPVLVTVGADSPAPRQAAAAALRDKLGYRIESLPGCQHFIQWDNPAIFAAVIRRVALELA
jgi:pimeloyl-ACP methyl ester carboxylesterase